ncbi:SOS response-associated peptidase family protein [Ideonella sp. DXS29W]|uniref:Abasic site processing protein n=1 Tax=Ideonella lacteola TaxID=2984193 RepID=A0ABU9BYL2_9BURK
MCNRYVSPEQAVIERMWDLRGQLPVTWARREIFPRKPGPFIRGQRDSGAPARELVVGQWGLVPWFAKTAKLTYSTNNARSEELTQKATFKVPWQRGQRCIIPAWTFDEPCWESGKNVWWRFARADGDPWGLAGIWNTWTDKATGEIVESYSMLTLNADAHSLMNRMHKPDPKLGPDEQDKRSVVPIEAADVDRWLFGSMEEAQSLIQLAPVEAFDAKPLP